MLVVQQGGGEDKPGPIYLQLVLLSTKGRILDRLQCIASTRAVGKLRCEIPTDGERECAQAVIRFDRATWIRELVPRHSLGHLSGNTDTFWELDKTGKGFEANVWRHEGLCRIRIFHGKLFVLFPHIGNPEAPLAEARD